MNTSTYLSGIDKKEYTDFIDLAVHELDAPLRKLSSFVEMLTGKFKANSSDSETQHYVVRIENCIDDMRSLIDDMSLLSRIISDKKEYSVFNLEAPIRQAMSELQSKITEKKAVIDIGGLPEVEGDKRQYVQLFRNLLDNAIKFSRKDIAPDIRVSSSSVSREEKELFNLADGKQYFRIEIRDNGIGFKKEYAEKIFQPFVRLHGKSQYSGHGLGLAVCRRIIENHDGFFYAESHENSGSCFVLILPQTIRQSC